MESKGGQTEWWLVWAVPLGIGFVIGLWVMALVFVAFSEDETNNCDEYDRVTDECYAVYEES